MSKRSPLNSVTDLTVLSLSTKRQWLFGAGVLCWALLSLAVLAIAEQQRYGVFDPDGHLSQQQKAITLPMALPGAQVLIAILDPSCACTRAARAHLATLQQQDPKLHIHEMTPAQWRQYGPELPATPAVLWYQQQQLRYAGPLAQGPVCSNNTDLLLPLLQGKKRLPGVWLNSETVACRCATG